MRWAALPRSACLALVPSVSGAASLRDGVDPSFGKPFERVVFHGHGPRSTSYYCYPRNYWWFYRPYTTANNGNARACHISTIRRQEAAAAR